MSDAVVEADATEVPIARKRSKLPLIIAAVVVLAGAAGGAWYFMSKGRGRDCRARRQGNGRGPGAFHLRQF